MAISSFLGLQTSLRGLLAQQQALDVTTHNVANANTVGYTRQEATLGAAAALHVTGGATQDGSGVFIGQGVDVTAYRRIRDSFLDLQVRAQTMALGDGSTSAQALDNVQSAVNEPSTTGINAMLSKFYAAWTNLSNHPEDPGAKTAVDEAAKTLADSFASLSSEISAAAAAAQDQLDATTGANGPIAAAAKSLAKLNKAIDSAVDAGQSPNDLLDQRDQILDQLSQYGNVSIVPQAGGRIQVMLGNQSVVSDTTVDWPATLPSTFSAGGGQLGALQTLTSTTLPGYLASLDQVATTLATDVNAAFGSTYFTVSTGVPGSVAAHLGDAIPAAVAGSGASGTNDVALAMSALSTTSAAGAQYAAFVRQVGADTDNAERAQSIAQAALDSAEDRRQNVSGVSLDEEMANLIRFQRGYQASARAMSSVDDLLDTLINRAGRVGL
ncbi:MAG TPA: flagellar hook-associated protein FlgK [Solirubrobacteraceae bacterium]|jgi:flagellar hook-associated protein 1 FlgK